LRAQPSERLINHADLVEWNLHKRYLQELQSRGVEIVPTRFFPTSTPENRVSAVLAEEDLDEFVLKPAISATSYLTTRHRRGDDLSAPLRALARQGDFLLQPFLSTVVEDGEASLIFFGDEFSHAVLKTAKPGDYRVQTDFGGGIEPLRPDPALIHRSREILALVPRPAQYARVDWIGWRNRPRLSELELIEPNLYFYVHPEAAARFARRLLS
jgi:hypothetical protein